MAQRLCSMNCTNEDVFKGTGMSPRLTVSPSQPLQADAANGRVFCCLDKTGLDCFVKASVNTCYHIFFFVCALNLIIKMPSSDHVSTYKLFHPSEQSSPHRKQTWDPGLRHFRYGVTQSSIVLLAAGRIKDAGLSVSAVSTFVV